MRIAQLGLVDEWVILKMFTWLHDKIELFKLVGLSENLKANIETSRPMLKKKGPVAGEITIRQP